MKLSKSLSSIPSLENHLAVMESTSLLASYQLGKIIDAKKNPISSRMYGIAIPAMCLVGETVKIAADTKRITSTIYHLVAERTLRLGNCRVALTHGCEHLRNIAGIITGLFVALYSPATARNLFLTVKTAKLNKQLTPETTARLYSIAYGVSEFLKRHQIEYRICHGTLLGALRHKGIIPWDDDMDFMIHPSSVDKCKSIFEEKTFQKETGLEVIHQRFTGGWQCFHPKSPKGTGELKNTGKPFLDIFATTFDEKKEKILIDSKNLQTLFSEEYLSPEEWKESAEYSFGPLKLTSIKHPNDYIHRRYGATVFDFAFQVFHHDLLASLYEKPFHVIENLRKLWEYDLPRYTYLEDRSPAPYSKQLYRKYVNEINSHLKQSH